MESEFVTFRHDSEAILQRFQTIIGEKYLIPVLQVELQVF